MDIEAARLAMALDCEGSIAIERRKRGDPPGYQYLSRVYVYNTDKRLVDWCATLFGFNVGYRPPRKSTYSGAYTAYLPLYLVPGVLTRVLPFLLLKQAQARLVMALVELTHYDRSPVTAEEWAYRDTLYQLSYRLNQKGPESWQ